MNSVISEMPGPEVAVKARAPFQPAPTTMPIEASSSLGLHDGVVLATGGRIDAELVAEYFWNASGDRRGRGDRIPRRHRGAAIDHAQRRRRCCHR